MRLQRRAPRPPAGSSRPSSLQPHGLLGLQQAAGNRAVALLVRSLVAQRAPGPGGGEPSTPGPGPSISLADAIEAQFTTAPYHLPSVLRLVRSAGWAERDAAFATASTRSAIIGALDEDGRVAVFSALLEGRPYLPDYESTIFQTYGPAKADEVSARVNERFAAAVGITRKLDWGESRDRPLARYWLRLRDEEVRGEIRLEEEQRFRDEVLGALAISTVEAESVITSGLAEHVAAALRDDAFMASLRDASPDFDAFTRLAVALGRHAPIGFELRNRAAVRTAFAEAWADSEPGPHGHEEGGWIYLNVVTGEISTRRADPTTAVGNRIQLGYPVEVDDSVLIGTFHTHPIPGPYQRHYSDVDEDLACNSWKVPSAIIAGEGHSKWFGPEVRERLSGQQPFPATGECKVEE